MFRFLFRRKSSDKGNGCDKSSGRGSTDLGSSPVAVTLPEYKVGACHSLDENCDSSSEDQYCTPSTSVSLNAESLQDSPSKLKKVIDPRDEPGSVSESKQESNEGSTQRPTTSVRNDPDRKLNETEQEIALVPLNTQMFSKDRNDEKCEIQGLQSQLRKLREDYETCTTAKRKVEIQLDDLCLKNNQLTQELWDKSESLKNFERESNAQGKRLLEANERARHFEREVNDLRKEKEHLVAEHDAIEIEREEELRALQNALDGALEQRAKAQNKMETEFKILRNSFATQEQQLMDDFEWKLRQIESNCKGKLRQKDIETEEKFKEARALLENETTAEREKLVQERRTVEDQMRLVCHYKAYEAELFQLRGLTHEQQRALRSAARQLEHYKFNEKVLHDEIRTNRKMLEKEKTNFLASQTAHQIQLEKQETQSKSKFEQEKTEINSKWECRLESERTRLRNDLYQVHGEEIDLAIAALKREKDQEFTVAKQYWANEEQNYQENDINFQISKLRSMISDLESSNRHLEKSVEKASQEKMALSKKLERTTGLHTESLKELKDTHASELESLRHQYEDNSKDVALLKTNLRVEIPTGSSGEVLKPPISTSSPINQTDSGCCDEDSSEESDYDSDEIEGGRMEKGRERLPATKTSTDNCKESDLDDVHHLRVEVASLQGSIEQLTTNLAVENNHEDQNVSDQSETENYDESDESN